MRKSSLYVLAVLFLMVSGCGGDGRPTLVVVEGTITVDGVPVQGATISFQPIDAPGGYKRPSRGRTDAQGKFKVGTYTTDDGLPTGKYKVGLELKELIGEIPEDFNFEDLSANKKPIQYRLIIPAAYANPEESGLTAEVTKKGLNPATFNVDTEGGTPTIENVGGKVRSNDP